MYKQSVNFNLYQLKHKKCKIFRNIFAFIISSFSVLSCSKEVEIDWQDDSQKYVIGCLFTPDEPVKLYAFTTTPILDDTTFFADGLDVEIYKNETLAWSGSGTGQGEYPIPVYAEADTKFKIILKDKNGLTISAEDNIPRNVLIDRATYLFPVYEDIYGSKFGKVSLSFQDEPEVKNYYEIVILGKDSSINQTFNVSSPVITLDNENDPYFPGTILFTDELFNGEKLDLNIFVSSYDTPTIVLKNISKSYYEYRKSINIHFYNQNVERYDVYSMFKGDPVELYSNVTNGLGIFAGYTQDIKKCTLINN